MRSAAELARELGVDFDRVEEVWVVTGTLVNEEPLRVGAPGEALGTAADLPLERLPDGRPYIPGSSLKGVLRSLAERILRSRGEYVCNPFVHPSRCEVAAKLARRLYEVANKWTRKRVDELLRDIERELAQAPPEAAELLEAVKSRALEAGDEGAKVEAALRVLVERGVPCGVCRLFGNTELASHVLVGNAYPEGATPPVAVRTRVAMDRFRRAARSGLLFTHEYVPRGYEWRFRLKAYNPGRSAELLTALLEYARELGLEVGSMRSVGLGLVRLKEYSIKRYRVKGFALEEVR